MPGGGAKPGERRGGRKKGMPNKATAVVRADLKEISDQTGHTGPTVLAHAMNYCFGLSESCKAAASIPGIGPEEQWKNMNLAEAYLFCEGLGALPSAQAFVGQNGRPGRGCARYGST